MNKNNPALDALNGMIEESDASLTESNDMLLAVINGIKTCGPLFSAALCYDSLEIDSDIDEMLAAAKHLIEAVTNKLNEQEIAVSDAEQSAINAFCIRVISENWKQSQEVYDEWVSPILRSLSTAGISAEFRSSNVNTPIGAELSANILASSNIFNALNKNTESEFNEDEFSNCIRELHQSVNKSIDKLVEFHIPYEDADQIRHHITVQASQIFVSVIIREQKSFLETQRKATIAETKICLKFPFDELYRHFKVAMDNFITAIYVNSRMVN